MKPIMDKTDKILLTLFLMSLTAYLVIFLSAFWDLPLNIPPWHPHVFSPTAVVPSGKATLAAVRPADVASGPRTCLCGQRGMGRPRMGPVSILVRGASSTLYSGPDCMGCWEAGPGEGQA